MIRNTKNVSVNDVQGYLVRGADVHPLLYYSFLNELTNLEISRKLCVTPQTRLEMYSIRVSQNITRRLAA
jgi:Mn-containing catalase